MATRKQFVERLMSNKKSCDLRLRKRGYGNSRVRDWTLQLVTRYNGKVVCAIGHENSKFVSLMMELGGFSALLIQDHEPGRCWSLRKSDLYRLSDIMGEKTSYELFQKVIEKTIQREKYLNFPIVRKEYENARKMLRAIRREIYTLFRYFTDSTLKQAALSALGSSKKVNNDTVKLQQVINRILNYHEDMAACVDRITTFENSIENKKLDCGGYFTKFGYGHDDRNTITLVNVLDEIDVARVAYYQRTKSILK